MDRIWSAVLPALCAVALLPALAQPAGDEATVLLDDFEAEPEGWRFVGGEEFPGAKGSLDRDTEVAHDGQASERLSADFSGGGAYVGFWKAMPDQEGKRIKEIRIWVKSDNVSSIGVRLGDSTEQCHQAKDIPIDDDGEWHQLVLAIDDLVGVEHWGGANDGKWHGPATGFGVNIGTPSIADGDQGALWFDNLSYVLTTAPLGEVTVLPCELEHDSFRPGFGTAVTYRWDAEPMGRDFTVFVHFIGPDGQMAFQGDHEPSVPTAVWDGRVEYDKTVVVPMDAEEGEYRIVLGLFSHAGRERNWDRQQLETAEGVEVGEDGTSYAVGTFTVDQNAPLPELGEPTLDLTGYEVTFEEEFDEPVDVSAWGPGTRWIAHTPYAGDFGDARFADPEEGFPFTVEDGILRIEARKDNDVWRSGLLCSVDPKGEGFSQQYGYFEMRAKLPKGEGTWPAFWLLGVEQLKDRSLDQIEIDILEQYGHHPNSLHTVVHLWYGDGRHTGDGRNYVVQGMTDDYHTYGCLVTEDDIIFYYDGVELRRVATPEEARVPLYVLVNLALGSGWPIDNTPNPSVMLVDYVRVYAEP